MNQIFEESVGVLTGKPIYTVYLKVGASKDWIMQYCVPGAGSAAPKQSMVVTLSAPAPLKAPYPHVTVVPDVDLLHSTRYTFIHALLDKAGKFSSLRLLGSMDKTIETALYNLLVQWEFRPATRDGAPVAVEVVLAIPPSKA
jgi:hypothetical protein